MQLIEEVDLDTIPTQKPQIQSDPFGKTITVLEIENRLSVNLYTQLSEGEDETTLQAIQRAQIYVGAILRNFSIPFNLDDNIIREVVLLHTIYELHIALGHEEAGREYRTKAKDIILVTWGDFKDSEQPTGAKVSLASVTTKRPPSKYRHAFGLQ